jgi:2-polyprenyl-3-methyl-5-hydroxy-6-metoxy-1,4-benzoquinol methylase
MAAPFSAHWLDHLCCWRLRRIFHNPKRILADFVKPGMTALDVGFGNGYYSIGMARMVGARGRVIAVETDQEKVETLQRKVTASGLGHRIEVRWCRAGDLAAGDLTGQVDFALALFVVHHADNIAALMTAVRHALKPKGTFLVIEPSHHAADSYCRSVESAARTAGLSVAGHPKIIRTWTVLLTRE